MTLETVECNFCHNEVAVPPRPRENRFRIVGDYILFEGQSVATLDPLMNASLRGQVVDVLLNSLARGRHS